MAGRRTSLVLMLLAILTVLCLGQGSFAKLPSKPAVSARKGDVKFIKCAVCEEIVKQLSRQVKKKREALAPKKLTELEIISLTENICDTKKEEAGWVMYLDIVEDGDRLKLVEQQQEGECFSECKTIERACEEVMGDHDTDVAEFLYNLESGRSGLSKLLCKDLSRACIGKPFKVPKGRAPGEPFIPKPSKDAEMAKLMRSMGDMPGAPGMQMYSRDQLQSGRGMGMGDEDEDEDDEDEDDDGEQIQLPPKPTLGREPFPSGLLGQSEVALGRLRSGVQNAVRSATHGVAKLSEQVSKWWSGSQSSHKQDSSKSSKATKSEL